MVAMPKQNVPTLRLEGFNGEWSQSVLGSFARKVNEKNVDLSVAETFTNSAEKGVISQTEYFKHQVSNDMNLGGYYVVQPNDFIYNPRISTGAPVGPINRNKLERVGVVSPLYTVFRLSLIDHSFLDWFFKSPYWHGFMRENGDSGARGDRLSIGQDLFFQMAVATPPTLEEQQAIGAIFTNLDAAINQHTLKHKSLQQAKTALMQRMFPQEGQTVPELRLEGFSGEWDVVKVGAIADSFSGGTPTVGTNAFYGGDIPFIRSSEISSSFTELTLTEAGLHSSSAKMVQPGWVLYALYGATAGEVSLAKIEGAINQAILALVPRDGFNAAYLVAWLRMNKKNITDTYLQGGQGNLSGALVKNLEVSVPPTLEEQQAIGAVFTNLDQLIAAEAQYIVSLKQAKTALLQRMFI